MNPNTAPTLAAVANDGILAGRELESDPELVALSWLKPRDLTLADLREAATLLDPDVDKDLLTQIQRAIEDQDFGLAGSSDVFRQIVLTGQTPGRPPIPDNLRYRVPCVEDSIPEVVSSPVMPIRSHHPDMACSAFKAKYFLAYTADGRPVAVYLDCDECDGCLAWRRYLNAKRFAHVCTRDATVVEIPSLPSVDAARAVATRLSRIAPGTRVTTLQRGDDYQWTMFSVWPTPVDHAPIVDSMERWEILGTIVDRPVTPAEFSSRCPLAKTVESATETRPDGNPKTRHLVRFHQWADYALADPNYR